ncbi:MAG: septum formation protein Maf [Kofleriaceae bacterium]|jgi:septum formation protein|nr:septum formation protein Maf [Kofleriaceae bacterium]MBP6841264.1 septum formation protein Maf [Kofleriaceae bacterium]MBP9207958.1 septum formation protein Maf [Kofleriaceae bacterium]
MDVLILASASPRRRELLERIGVAIEVLPADVDESLLPGEAPGAYVARVARAKAAALTVRNPGRWVLAADTIVELDGQVLGKAEAPAEAAAMVSRLAGRTHQVSTAFVLAGPGQDTPVIQLVTTEVDMVELDEAAVAAYVASGEWRGKAGAYAVQGIGAALVRQVRGSITNVIGLPLAEVAQVLVAAGAPAPHLERGQPA